MAKEIWPTWLKSKKPIQLVGLDVSAVKAINTSFGADMGDIYLKHVADALREEVEVLKKEQPQIDAWVSRYGNSGDEMFVGLHNASLEQTKSLMQKIRTRVQAFTTENPELAKKMAVLTQLSSSERKAFEAACKQYKLNESAMSPLGKYCLVSILNSTNSEKQKTALIQKMIQEPRIFSSKPDFKAVILTPSVERKQAVLANVEKAYNYLRSAISGSELKGWFNVSHDLTTFIAK